MTQALVNSYAATVAGGFFSQYSGSLSGQTTGGGLRRRAAFALSRRGALALRAVATTLNGAVAGSTATKTIGRVEANAELGGQRTIETKTLMDAATVSGDITTLNDDLFAYTSTFGASPPANLDGNPLGTR